MSQDIFQQKMDFILEKCPGTVGIADDIAVHGTTEEHDSNSDPELTALREIIYSGWPEKRKQVPVSLRKYWAYRDELTIENGLVLKGERVIVP